MIDTKSAFVAIVGKPNVGKSTLLNALVGEKIAIVSDRPQTTRNRITGVITKDEIQYVFIDTPGLHKPKTKLSEYMVKQVNDSVADVDIVILVVEPDGEINRAEHELIGNIKAMGLPSILVINKIDTLTDKDILMKRIAEFSELHDFNAVIPVSAHTGDGISIIFDELAPFSYEGPHFFDSDSLTDQPERVIVGEIIREKLLLNLNEEVPHGTAVTIEQMKDREHGYIIDIDAVIYCEKQSHKGIIIGKGGRMLKKIATEARQEIENFLDSKVNLQCWVKVKDDWRNHENVMRTFGYN